jgi:hypothetical protein
MKVGDMVKHTPWKDEYAKWVHTSAEFMQGLIVEAFETSKDTHYLISTPGRSNGWYRETELEVISLSEAT